MSDEIQQINSEEVQITNTNKKKFNWANLPIITVIILLLILFIMIALSQFVINDMTSLTGTVYFTVMSVVSIAYQLFTFFCLIALVFQFINKNKTLWDKIFLTLNLVYLILIISYICLVFAYMKQIKVE